VNGRAEADEITSQGQLERLAFNGTMHLPFSPVNNHAAVDGAQEWHVVTVPGANPHTWNLDIVGPNIIMDNEDWEHAWNNIF
jgi:hypothetical protein